MSANISAGNYVWVNQCPVSGYPFTLACKFNPDIVTGFQSLLGIWNPSVEEEGHFVGFDGQEVRAISTSLAATSFAYANRLESAGALISVVARFYAADNRDVIVNADFANAGTDATSVAFGSPTTTYFGAVPYGGGAAPADGAGAELGIWSDDLSNSDIEAYHAGYSPVCIRRDALVRCWPLIGPATLYPDLRGNLGLTRVGTPDHLNHIKVLRPRRPTVTVPLPAAAMGSSPSHRLRFVNQFIEGIY